MFIVSCCFVLRSESHKTSTMEQSSSQQKALIFSIICAITILFGYFHLCHVFKSPLQTQVFPEMKQIIFNESFVAESEQKTLSFCQTSENKLVYKDIKTYQVSGLLHKFDDFLQACKTAVITNRILVDFSPSLKHRQTIHHPDAIKDAVKSHPNNFWKFGHLFNITTIKLKIKYGNVSQKSSFSSLIQSVSANSLDTKP